MADRYAIVAENDNPHIVERERQRGVFEHYHVYKTIGFAAGMERLDAIRELVRLANAASRDNM